MLTSINIKVNAYNESDDSFSCTVTAGQQVKTHNLPAFLVAHAVNLYGSPDEFIGKTFTVHAK